MDRDENMMEVITARENHCQQINFSCRVLFQLLEMQLFRGYCAIMYDAFNTLLCVLFQCQAH